ncbi:MAG: hypothetical protein ACI4RO_03315 [Candidatus Scatosoma sp.]
MKNYMKKSAALSHVFFTFAFCFLLFLCAFRYLRLPLALSVLFALAVACCAAALIAAFLGRKREKYLFSLRAEKEKEALLLYLSLSSPAVALGFLSSLYPETFYHAAADNAAAVKNTGAADNAAAVKNTGATDNAAPQRESVTQISPPREICDNLYRAQNGAFFSFSSRRFSLEKSETLLRALGDAFSEKKRDDRSAALFCSGADEDAAALLTRFGVKIFTAEDVFARTKETNAFPREVEELAKEKKAKKFVLRGITKKTSRGLLVSAGILLFTSLFSPFPYYYRALSLILLALSLAVRLLAVKSLFSIRAASPKQEKNASDKRGGKHGKK